jgi:hypothetical protein
MTKRYNIPLEAVLGGPETMYPEYRKWLKGKCVPPPPVAPGGRDGRGGRGAIGASLTLVGGTVRTRFEWYRHVDPGGQPASPWLRSSVGGSHRGRSRRKTLSEPMLGRPPAGDVE